MNFTRHRASEAPSVPAGSQPSLARAAVGGVAWVGLSYFITRITLLIATVVLARTLSPTDFGVYALALAFITYAEVVNDLGVAQALILLPADDRQNDAALTVSLVVSAVLVGVAMITAPFVARFFGHPDVGSILRVLSLALLLRALGQVPDAILIRDLRFRERFRANASRALVQCVMWVAFALAGAGVWSLVYGYLAGYAVNSLILWRLVSYRPGPAFWRITRARVQPLLSYAAPLVGSVLLLALVNDIDYLIVGRRLGTDALGYYTVAFRVPQMVISNTFLVFSVVMIPVLVRAGQNATRFHRGYVRTLRIQTTFGLSVATGLAVAAPLLVPVLFGARWTPSIAPLGALSLYAVFRSLAWGATDVYKGMGRPRLAFWSSLVWLAALVPTLLISTRWGIEGVAWGQLVVAVLAAITLHGVAVRSLRLPLSRLAGPLGVALLASAGTAIGAGTVRAWLPGPGLLRLAAVVIAGIGFAVALVHLADRRFLPTIVGLLLPGRGDPEADQNDSTVESTT
jgi:lipopolysaccharide exporter